VKIYTKTGDKGETGLFGGLRVKKNDARVEAYGTVDELNATIGLARAHPLSEAVAQVLEAVQSDLFTLGAELAVAPGKEDKLRMRRIDGDDVARLERALDAMEAALEPLRSFILPGGTHGASALHLARTVCRRAERRVIAARDETPVRGELIVYLNRLSDLLFVLARRENHDVGVVDVLWNPEGPSD
jgi:cob(I)alamin adenosyltransferase